MSRRGSPFMSYTIFVWLIHHAKPEVLMAYEEQEKMYRSQPRKEKRYRPAFGINSLSLSSAFMEWDPTDIDFADKSLESLQSTSFGADLTACKKTYEDIKVCVLCFQVKSQFWLGYRSSSDWGILEFLYLLSFLLHWNSRTKTKNCPGKVWVYCSLKKIKMKFKLKNTGINCFKQKICFIFGRRILLIYVY